MTLHSLLDGGPRPPARRREFLALCARASGLVALGALPARGDEAAWRAREYPFALGVASGDPAPGGFVLWTRLGHDPLNDGGLPPRPLTVAWEVARDESFSRVAARGEAVALPALAHSVHVEVEGLEPGRGYFYRFIAGGERSPVGHARTAPAGGSATPLVFGVASCQSYQSGYFTALRHLAEEELDAVLFLGDYIYESGPWGRAPVRSQGPEVRTLAEYRARYALHKLDPDLQAAHARHAFVATWDDHEVANNYAGDVPQRADSRAAFLARRAAAYQAFYEHLPLRRSSLPRGPFLRLYRPLAYGGLADLFVLDTRQYRTDQPCGDGITRRCPGTRDPEATMLGAAQRRWLLEGLARSTARWRVVLNQVPFGQIDNDPGPEETFDVDKWDGYLAERRRLLGAFADHPARPVVLTGDMHANVALDLKADFDDAGSRVVGAEFVVTSISTAGDGDDLPGRGRAMLEANPHMRFFNGQRGYLRCRLTDDAFTTDFRVLPYVTRPGAPVSTRATFRVERTRPGLQQA
jgi:alkaline phosphatase D